MPNDNTPNTNPTPAMNTMPAAAAASSANKYLYIAIAAGIVIIAGIAYMLYAPSTPQLDTSTVPAGDSGAPSPSPSTGAAVNTDAQLDAAMPQDSSSDFQSVDANINQL